MEKSHPIDQKITLLKSIEYSNDFNFISSLFLKWQKQKPTETIDKAIGAFNRMYFYSFNMEEEIRHLRDIVSQYRADKNNAIERARKAEEKNTNLEKKLNIKL